MYDKIKFSKAYLNDSEHYLFLAKTSLEKNKYNSVIRECQTSSELAIKSILFKLGRVVPKTHNLRFELKEVKELLNIETQKDFDFLYKVSNRLYSEKEQSLYGDPDLDKTPEESYSLEDAKKYLKDTEDLIKICVNELKDILD